MNRNRVWWLAPIVVVVVGFLMWRGGGDGAAVPTTKAVRGDFVVATSTGGELAAVNSVPVPAPRGWNNKVVTLTDEGTSVDRGDTLAVFDTDQQQQRLEERRTSYEQAQAQLENQRATNAKTLAQKEATLQRQKLALERAILNTEAMRFESASRQRQQELEQRRVELDVREAEQDLAAQRDIAAAELAGKEAEVRKSQLDLQRAESDLATLTVTAPDSGLVVHKKIWAGGETRKIRVGDAVWNGWTIMELPDLSAFLVRTWVHEVDIHRLELDQEVEVTVDAVQDRALQGKVTRIATLARQEGDDKLKVFDVDVELSGDVSELLPGMTAQCRIIHQRLSDVVRVSQEAIFRQGEQTVVYPGGGGGPREVTLGPAGEDDVVVTEGVDADEELRLVAPGDHQTDGDS